MDEQRTLWPGDPKTWPAKLPEQKRGERQQALLDAGRHPLHGGEIRTDGETCGSCSFLDVHQHGRRYYKCRLRKTSGPATDVRLRWPGCKWWEKAGTPEGRR